MRKFNIFTVLLIPVMLVASLISPLVSALSDPDIETDAALLVETISGNILHERNKDIRVAPGGIAKIMTLLLAVIEVENEQEGLQDSVTASETFLNGIGENDATLKIKPGETMSYKDLMYCAYIASANDACNILAEHIDGSIMEFVGKMNAKAKELGCRDTHFMNPGGLTDPGQYTSAWDQYLIFKEAVSHPLFLEIAGMASYQTEADDDSPDRSFINPNLMLQEQHEYYYEYCAAGKTATSGDYGSSLVSYAKNSELSLISVVFGVKSTEGKNVSSFSETIRLFEWGFSCFSWLVVVTRHETVVNEKIALAKGTDKIRLRPSAPITILARNDLTAEDIKKDIVVFGQGEEKVLMAPVKKGDILGEITVTVDGAICGKVNLVAAQDVALDRGAFIKSHITDTLSIFWVQLGIFLLLVLIGFYIWLVIRDRMRRREEKRRIEEVRKKIVEERQRIIR